MKEIAYDEDGKQIDRAGTESEQLDDVIALLQEVSQLPEVATEGELVPLEWLLAFEHEGERLTLRDVKFIACLFKTHFSKSEAILMSGYYKGPYPGPAATSALKRPAIQAALKECQRYIMRKMGISTEASLMRLHARASTHIGHVLRVSEDGKVSVRTDIPLEAMYAIKSIQEQTLPNGQRTVKIELHDALKAEQDLRRALGLDNDRLKQEAIEDIADALAQARERVINAAKISRNGKTVTFEVEDAE